MKGYRVVPIGSDASGKVRGTMRSPHGDLPAWSLPATGYGPCRSCLKTFKQGEEERIYFSYDPFAGISDLPLPGPVFIHTDPCEEYSSEGFPTELRSIPLLLEGFGGQSRLVTTHPLVSDNVDEQILEVLNTPDVKFIHLRNAEAGCYVARIEKMEAMV